jgi:N-glycosidase YbiA
MPSGCTNDLRGERWATVEHYYQAHKFQGTRYEDLMAKIQAASTPELAAGIGRNSDYQPRSDWDRCKCEIMYGAVRQKFSQHLDLQQILLDTQNAEIIEDSPVDYFWGGGLDRSGQNQLGRILMQVRAEFNRDRSIR